MRKKGRKRRVDTFNGRSIGRARHRSTDGEVSMDCDGLIERGGGRERKISMVCNRWIEWKRRRGCEFPWDDRRDGVMDGDVFAVAARCVRRMEGSQRMARGGNRCLTVVQRLQTNQRLCNIFLRQPEEKGGGQACLTQHCSRRKRGRPKRGLIVRPIPALHSQLALHFSRRRHAMDRNGTN